MANPHQAYLKSLEEDYERPQLVRNLMPSPGSSLGVAVTLAAGQRSPVVAGPINFTVTFSRPVTGFTNADVSFVGSTVGGTLAAAVTGTGPAYNVAVTGMTGNGLVAVSVVPAAAVDAVTGVPSPGSIAATVQMNADVTAPSVVLSKAAGQADPASVGPINFTAVFSEPVQGLPVSALIPSGTTAAGNYTAVVTGSGTTYNIAISGMTGGGNVSWMVTSGGTTDFAGNPNTASNVVAVAFVGGFPGVGNTGPTSGLVLTPVSGDVNSTIDGQVIEKLNVTGQIIVRHANVTIQDCVVNCTEFFAISTVGVVPGLRVLRVTINGNGNAAGITPDSADGTEIGFCNIQGTVNGINVAANNMNIHDNFIHNLQGGATAHIDGIQGSGGFTALTINHNTIISWDTSCIILQNEGAAFSGVTITNNKLLIDAVLGGAFCILCQDLDTGVGAVSNVTVTGNRMRKGTGPGQTYGFFHNVTALTWNTNVDDTTGATINPDIG